MGSDDPLITHHCSSHRILLPALTVTFQENLGVLRAVFVFLRFRGIHLLKAKNFLSQILWRPGMTLKALTEHFLPVMQRVALLEVLEVNFPTFYRFCEGSHFRIITWFCLTCHQCRRLQLFPPSSRDGKMFYFLLKPIIIWSHFRWL